jgi:membrane fusion protein (multidrug efflux system)
VFPFPQTARLLARESPALAALTLASTVALLGAWCAWFSLAHVAVYESSEQARLEVLRASHPVEAPVAGRVVEVRIALDGEVHEGDPLVRLDSSAEQLELDQTRAKIAGIGPQLEALRKGVEAERQALTAHQSQLSADLAEAESRLHEQEIMAHAGELEAERNEQLFAENLVTDVERQRAYAEAARRKAAEATARAQLEKLRRESATGSEDRRSRIVSLDREVAGLAAQLESLKASIPSLEHAIELRTIRAPGAGRIGETAGVRIGQVLGQGAHIATVVAPGDLRVVASFPPTAFGRVRPGQGARVRLDAFPWAEYGMLRATVSQVATELHEGQARIELTVDRPSAQRIPLQHGLPGHVEVVVEEASPARLVLRAAGKLGT